MTAWCSGTNASVATAHNGVFRLLHRFHSLVCLQIKTRHRVTEVHIDGLALLKLVRISVQCIRRQSTRRHIGEALPRLAAENGGGIVARP